MIENYNSSVVISGVELTPKIYNGQRVVTFQDIDAVHQRPEGTAKRNFAANRDRLVEGEDYYILSAAEIKSTNFVPLASPRGLTVITESGYLLLVKSFTDDLAWQVQKELRAGYFTAKQQPKPMSTAEMLLMQAQLNVDVERRLAQHDEAIRSVRETQQEQAQAVKEVVGVFALPTVKREQWCEQMNRRISAICSRDNIPHQKFRGDTYRELEDTARINLESRLTRAKRRLKEAGEKAVVYRNYTKLQVISEDAKLRPIYEGIVRKYDAQNLASRYFS